MNRDEMIRYLANVYVVLAADADVERGEERVFENIARHMRASFSDRKKAMELAASEGVQIDVAARWSLRIANLEDMMYAAFCNGEIDPGEKARDRRLRQASRYRSKAIESDQARSEATLRATKLTSLPSSSISKAMELTAPPMKRRAATHFRWLLWCAFLPASASAWMAPTVSRGADRIVLRNLTILSGQTVTRMSVDGVVLSDGKVLRWDDIESGRVAANQQELFNKYVKNLGSKLFRIRRRLEVGDYPGLLPHAEEIERFYFGRVTPTAYMVHQAVMWGRLSHKRRAAAVAPYLRAYGCLRASPNLAKTLPGDRQLAFDRQTGICDELPPVWFDVEAARRALPEVRSAISQWKSPLPTVARIYFSSLAIAVCEDRAADQALAGIDAASGPAARLRNVLLAQREVQSGSLGDQVKRLQANLPAIDTTNRPLALYWLGRAGLMGENADVRQGVLTLLSIPAAHGRQQPELAAAALYQAMVSLDTLGDAQGSVAIREELLAKYGHTYHAALAEGNKKPDAE